MLGRPSTWVKSQSGIEPPRFGSTTGGRRHGAVTAQLEVAKALMAQMRAELGLDLVRRLVHDQPHVQLGSRRARDDGLRAGALISRREPGDVQVRLEQKPPVIRGGADAGDRSDPQILLEGGE